MCLWETEEKTRAKKLRREHAWHGHGRVTIAVAEYVRRKIQETRLGRVMGRAARSGEVLSDILRALAFTPNELERRILSKKVTGFYLYFCRIIPISRLRID